MRSTARTSSRSTRHDLSIVVESVNKAEIRCDSLTSEPESHLVLCSYAATRKLRLRTADITNAYFQAAPMMRLLLMAPPRGGLTMFDAEIPEDAVLMCRVPVYGTKDAGRGFYLRMNTEILAQGFVASHGRFALRHTTFSARTCILPQ